MLATFSWNTRLLCFNMVAFPFKTTTQHFLLWHEYTNLVTTDVPNATLSTIQNLHKTSQHDNFLMKLRPEYESVHSSLLNRSLVPSLDICFGELLNEERLSTQAILEQSHGSFKTTTMAYATQGHGSPVTSKNLQCFCCKEYGHIVANCLKNIVLIARKNVILSKNVVSAPRIIRPKHFILLFL